MSARSVDEVESAVGSGEVKDVLHGLGRGAADGETKAVAPRAGVGLNQATQA